MTYTHLAFAFIAVLLLVYRAEVWLHRRDLVRPSSMSGRTGDNAPTSGGQGSRPATQRCISHDQACCCSGCPSSGCRFCGCRRHTDRCDHQEAN